MEIVNMKKIVITGVSTGIGYATAKILCKAGYKVYGSVRNNKDAKKVRKELGDNFQALIFDVTDIDGIIKNAEKVKQDLEPGECLAGLVNNAGIALGGPISIIKTDVFRKQFEVNLFGLIDVTKNYLPLLGGYKNSDQQGKIVNISSISGLRSNPFTAPYCASKFALEAFSDALRKELMIYGVDVILVEPGPFKTDIWEKTPDPNNNEFLGSDYEKSLKQFYKFVIELGKKSWPPEIIGNKIRDIFQNPNPSPRHVITPNYFSHYILSGILPTRIYDKLVAKKLSLTKKASY